jgi:hypothetical protein
MIQTEVSDLELAVGTLVALDALNIGECRAATSHVPCVKVREGAKQAEGGRNERGARLC